MGVGRWLALPAVALASLLAACGGGHQAASVPIAPAKRLALPVIETKDDPDYDSDNYAGEPDNERELFGHPASAADARAVAVVVKRYFAAAARDDGALGCTLLYSPSAESIAQTLGGPGGSPGLQGSTCAVVMTKLFAREHRRFRAAAVKVTAVRVSFSRGAVQFRFGDDRATLYTLVHRERDAWKMYDLLYIKHPEYVE